MNLPKLFQCGGALRSLTLGVALAGAASLVRVQAESANGDWPRAYSVDDDDIVIYQPKIEKWDQKLLVARFAVGVKSKGDAKPIYGSFVAQADTESNMETRTVSLSHVTAVDFKFPDAGNRIDRIKRDIAAVSPEKPLSLPLDELVASMAAGDAVTEETIPDEAPPSEAANTPAKPDPARTVKKVSNDPPVVITMEKGEFPQVSPTEEQTTSESDDPPAKVERPIKTKSTATQERAPQRKAPVSKKIHKEDSAPKAERLKKDDDEDDDSAKVVRTAAPGRVRVLHKTEPKPHVVRYVRGTDNRFACFDRKVYCGAHGEIVRHSEKHRVVKIRHGSREDRS